MRKRTKKAGLKATAVSLCGAMTLLFAAGAAVGTTRTDGARAAEQLSITVDVGVQYQTLDGWGSTLAWWANEIGDWTKPSIAGTEQRDYIMEMLYGESGLNWNIARYNVGGGDEPSHGHMPDARNMPGFKGATVKEGMDIATSNDWNRYTYYKPDEKYTWESDESEKDIAWDATDEQGNPLITDYNQIWVLDWIQKNRKDVMTEYFSNSPPYWMTYSGCASGAVNKGENLPDENIEAYITYFLDVYEYLVGQGFTFDYLQPFNEPSTGFWGMGGSQEGCDFHTSKKILALNELFKQAKERKIEQKYNFSDETNTSTAVKEMKNMLARDDGKAVLENIDKLTYHIYGRSIGEAQQMYRYAVSTGKEIEMSEICFAGDDVRHDPELMSAAFQYSDTIIDILKYCGAQSYIFWQAVEDKVGQINGKTNYGLLQGVYYTADECRALGVDVNALGLSYQDVTTSKAYYVSGQYSKYMKKGYKIVEVGDDRSLAALSPDGSELVIVKQNSGEDSIDLNYTLNNFKARSIKRVVTDKNSNWAESYIPCGKESFTDTVTPSSVTTYIVSGQAMVGEMRTFDDAAAISKSNLADIQSAIGAEPEKEALYYCGFTSDSNSTKNYLFGSTVYSNSTSSYAVLRFKGTGFAFSCPMKSDAAVLNVYVDKLPSTGDITAEVNLKSTTSKWRSLAYNSLNEGIVLDDDWHTMYIQIKSGYFNLDVVYSLQGGKIEEQAAPMMGDVGSKNGKVYLEFTSELGVEEYDYYAMYRPVGSKKEYTSDAVAHAIAGEDGKYKMYFTPEVQADIYEVWVKAVKGSDERLSALTSVSVGKEESSLLYFVDCGTSLTTGNYPGRRLGTLNSKYDQPYGKDLATGKSWGYEGVAEGKSYSLHSASDPFISVTDGTNFTNKQIVYKFAIPTAGTYRVSLGLLDQSGSKEYSFEATVGGASVVVDDSGAAATLDAVAVGKTPVVSSFLIATTEADSELTLKIKGNSSATPRVSLILIGDEDLKMPLVTDCDSNYATGIGLMGGKLKFGADYDAETRSAGDGITVLFSNGETMTYGGASVTRKPRVITTQSEPGEGNEHLYRAYYAIDVAGYETIVVPAVYTVLKNTTELLYNIDCGSDGMYYQKNSVSFVKGTLQNTEKVDQAYVEGGWGYYNANKPFWADGNPLSSILELKNGGGYTLENFTSGQPLTVVIGVSDGDWGGRSFKVSFNGGSAKDLKCSKNEPKVFSFDASANESGVLKMAFTNNNATVGYIRVYARGMNGGDVEALTAPTSDKSVCDIGETIKLRGITSGARVYIADGSGTLVDSFVAESDSINWSAWDKVSREASSLKVWQATVSAVSPALVIALPHAEVEISNEIVAGEDMVAVRIVPVLANADLQQIYVVRPDKLEVDVIDSFFLRTQLNGKYTVVMVCNGVTTHTEFVVDTYDTLTIGVVYSTTEATSDDVTVTLAPVATSGIKALYVNDAKVKLAADGTYVITATENSEYAVKAESNEGTVEEYTVTVANIDRTTASLDITPVLDSAAGVGVNIDTGESTGGVVYITKNGGIAEQLVNSDTYTLTEAGKYEFIYQNAKGEETAKQTYYLSYGAVNAKTATVTMAENGTITVTGATATLYKAGDTAALSSLKATDPGKYYLQLTSAQGTETVIINTLSTGASTGASTGTGPANVTTASESSFSVANVILAIIFGMSAAAVLAWAVIIFIKRRRA